MLTSVLSLPQTGLYEDVSYTLILTSVLMVPKKDYMRTLLHITYQSSITLNPETEGLHAGAPHQIRCYGVQARGVVGCRVSTFRLRVRSLSCFLKCLSADAPSLSPPYARFRDSSGRKSFLRLWNGIGSFRNIIQPIVHQIHSGDREKDTCLQLRDVGRAFRLSCMNLITNLSP